MQTPPPATMTTTSSSSSNGAKLAVRRTFPKKLSDPFLDMSNHSPAGSGCASPRPPSPAHGGSVDNESLFTKIILTPLLAASFILSLFIVDRRNRSYRANEHPSAPIHKRPTSPPSFFSPSSWGVTSWWRNWLDPQPYQTGDGTWSTETKEGQDEAEGEREGHEGKWFLHKKHRQMAKLELVDAFELRKLVIAILVGSAAVVLLVGVWVSRVALTRFWQ